MNELGSPHRLSSDGNWLLLPALSSAHSHAFQRALRGRAQRRANAAHAGDTFWTWRSEMYRLAMTLTPQSLAEISRVAFLELAQAGVRTVGEFHYVHHQACGTPYAERTLLSRVVIDAAKSAGLRIALLRVAYHRAGAGLSLEPAQRRFCDANVDDVLRDVSNLRAHYRADPDVRVGIAPHSVRAVPRSWLRPLADYANSHQLPFHMHVAEQQREVDECLAETQLRPLELVAAEGGLSPRFVAVHATHIAKHEARLLGQAAGFACLCPTTERDLGDGLADVAELRASGVRLCTGIDSHVITDPLEEMRSLETHERLRTGRRVTFEPANGTLAAQLWREGSLHGALACGFEDEGGAVRISASHPTLRCVTNSPEDDRRLDAIVFSGHSAMIEPLTGGG